MVPGSARENGQQCKRTDLERREDNTKAHQAKGAERSMGRHRSDGPTSPDQRQH